MTILPSGHAQPQPAVEPDADLAVVGRSRRTLRITSIVVTALAVAVLFAVVGFQALIVRNQSRLDDSERQHRRSNPRQPALAPRSRRTRSPRPDPVGSHINLGMIVPDDVTYLEPISAEDLSPSDGGPG